MVHALAGGFYVQRLDVHVPICTTGNPPATSLPHPLGATLRSQGVLVKGLGVGGYPTR